MSTSGSNLDFGLNGQQAVNTAGNLSALRSRPWTDPSDGTGFVESQNAGHDTDNDFLPDGWEVEFNLNPRSSGSANGPFGDPDADGLLNVEEFVGQDGERDATYPYINGTGDESNPNTHNTRPDETYSWRWKSTNFPASFETDSRAGLGINRPETLGSALPTASVGADAGTDTDDDGIADLGEITNTPSSPVHSVDPFRPKSVRVTNSSGILIPDPTPAAAEGFVPAGTREDLQGRDWTIECYVKLAATNLTGNIFDFQTVIGFSSRRVYRLALSNSIPTLSAQGSAGSSLSLTTNALATGQWMHLAGVWDHKNNMLKLYVQGVLRRSTTVSGESAGIYQSPATNVLAFGASADGSFVNNLMLDEIRIWGVARTAQQISNFVNRLVPQANGDDVWINAIAATNAGQVYFDLGTSNDVVLVHGGSLVYGEQGIVITNAFCTFENQPPAQSSTWGIYTEGEDVWIDDGDSRYSKQDDVLIRNGGTLIEGEHGRLLFAISNASVLGQVVWADKDQSGDFNARGLLAYYRFDDGGTSAEDFARKAKSGLLGTRAEDYSFGDRGYALSNGFAWVTNDAAPVLGIDSRGADDSDGDGMPDGWESVMNLDPYDNGSSGETTPGAMDGVNGALADPDSDGLPNWFDYAAGTNPRDSDSDGDGTPDALEDPDGDGLTNLAEYRSGTDPLDPESFLGLVSPPGAGSPAGLLIRWMSKTGKVYSVNRSSNLAEVPAFTSLAAGVQGQVDFTTYTDTTAAADSPHIYRIVIE
jgi:hypothetical protein